MKQLIALFCLLLLGFATAIGQTTHTVEELTSNQFTPTITTEVFSATNGLTYFVEAGQLQSGKSVVPAKIVWTDGTQSSSFVNTLQALRGVESFTHIPDFREFGFFGK